AIPVGTGQTAAQLTGGSLVSITSAEEQAFLERTFLSDLGDNRAAMGMYDPAGGNNFQWITGEPVTYTNWAPGEPNNSGSFGVWNQNNTGQWDDTNADARRDLMEFNSAPNLAVMASIFGNSGGGGFTIANNFIGTD